MICVHGFGSHLATPPWCVHGFGSDLATPPWCVYTSLVTYSMLRSRLLSFQRCSNIVWYGLQSFRQCKTLNGITLTSMQIICHLLHAISHSNLYPCTILQQPPSPQQQQQLLLLLLLLRLLLLLLLFLLLLLLVLYCYYYFKSSKDFYYSFDKVTMSSSL